MVSTWTGSGPCLKEASSVSGDNGGFMEVLWRFYGRFGAIVNSCVTFEVIRRNRHQALNDWR